IIHERYREWQIEQSPLVISTERDCPWQVCDEKSRSDSTALSNSLCQQSMRLLVVAQDSRPVYSVGVTVVFSGCQQTVKGRNYLPRNLLSPSTIYSLGSRLAYHVISTAGEIYVRYPTYALTCVKSILYMTQISRRNPIFTLPYSNN
ncbi:hypothetical protein SAMN04488028_106223, partial [Reichenbachiella agariperforans]